MNVNYDATLYASSSSCSDSFTNYCGSFFVFNCDSLYHPANDLGYPSLVQQERLNDPNSLALAYAVHPNLYIYDYPLNAHINVNWGNGKLTDTTQSCYYSVINCGGYGTGSVRDTANAPGYARAGWYNVSAQVTYSLGTMSCPALRVPPITIWASDSSIPPPVLSGTLSLCAGDTLRLQAFDTSTSSFGSRYRRPDTTGTGSTAFASAGGYGETFTIGWSFGGTTPRWDAIYTDSTFVLENVLLADAGTYEMQIFDGINTIYVPFFIKKRVDYFEHVKIF
jgi:hypothetical protein